MCGCNKRSAARVPFRNPSPARQALFQRTVSPNPPGVQAQQVQALSLPGVDTKTTARMSEERQRIEKARRDAIRNRLNK